MLLSSNKIWLEGIEELEHDFNFNTDNNYIIVRLLHESYSRVDCCRCVRSKNNTSYEKNACLHIENIVSKIIYCMPIKVNYLAKLITDLPVSCYKIWCVCGCCVSNTKYVSLPSDNNEIVLYI